MKNYLKISLLAPWKSANLLTCPNQTEYVSSWVVPECRTSFFSSLNFCRDGWSHGIHGSCNKSGRHEQDGHRDGAPICGPQTHWQGIVSFLALSPRSLMLSFKRLERSTKILTHDENNGRFRRVCNFCYWNGIRRTSSGGYRVHSSHTSYLSKKEIHVGEDIKESHRRGSRNQSCAGGRCYQSTTISCCSVTIIILSAQGIRILIQRLCAVQDDKSS